ncbi:6-pyruvoyl tetrahydropterin synthase [candidate division WOR_3 bacterium SM23_42]|uniref:6-carboxy-5,6,7,8-tetrahydropterin synthase n=1 Tax=candidate division WOR_3 bacterium SM23_42 TaxID=1703779 RepID=A0A0S8FQ22_UNCW3|nr:MAG: 6-pyruvoyl tetrahydropterin synthase [candidate division WOR_3 bacterium SM23_42]
MYTISVRRDFTAYHYLVGGNWGPENDKHAHHYGVQIELEGHELNRYGYLVDIVDIERAFDTLVRRYEKNTLNGLKEFEDLNPSIENFSRILCCGFISTLETKNVKAVKVKIWEDDIACASFRQEL